LTLREVLWAVESRQTDSWSRTAHLLATILNVNRDPKRSKAISPADLMPQRRRRHQAPITTDISALKVFLKGTTP
jgi:hypothetical protein